MFTEVVFQVIYRFTCFKIGLDEFQHFPSFVELFHYGSWIKE